MAFNETLAADGDSKEFKGVGAVRIRGNGTFGGGIVIVEERDVDGVFSPIEPASFTSAFDQILDIGVEQATLRFSLSGSTTPSLDVSARGEITNNG